MGQHQRGQFDDTIVWLKTFEGILEMWAKTHRASGAFSLMERYMEHARRVEGIASLPNWKQAASHDKTRTMHWIAVAEAFHDMVGHLEGWRPLSDEDWAKNLESVRAARTYFEQHNPPEESPVKF